MQFLKYFCLFWTGTLLGSSERQTKNIINTYIAAYIIPAAYAIFQVLKSGSLEYMATGTLGEHHSSLGTNMHIPLFLLTGMMLKDKNAGLSRIILTVFFFSALVMAQSRAALGSFLIALPALIFLKIRFKVILKAAAWFSAIILLFYFSGLFQAIFDLTFRSRYGLKIDLSSYSRLIIWQSALNFFIEAPIIQKIIGCGPGAFSQNVFFEYNFWSDKIISGGHNNFIHVLVETGIFGLLAFMFFWSSIILRSAFISRSEVNRTALYLLTVSLFISCIGQDTLWMLTWHGYLLPAYFLLLGLFSGKSDLTNSVHSPGKISSS
ncbi:MAG: O-antigen ligase family protein [Fibrobacterota bacterium]